MDVLINLKKKFNNPNLKKIVNVYQMDYNFGISHPPGFGDYLKSCFFLLHICKALNLEFDMNFKNHPISKYLVVEHQDDIDFSKIEYPEWGEHNYIDKNGLNAFINNLNSVSDSNYYFFTNGWPFLKIKIKGINIIKSKLIPNEFLEQHINMFMNKLNLERKKYVTIHLRCSDDIFDGKSDTRVLQKFKNILLNISLKNDCKCLILSNSNRAKYLIKDLKLNNVCFKVSGVTHLGNKDKTNNVVNYDDGVLDTMKDFFVMSNSKLIISLSVYGWGSCFSDMCSQIYSVPIIKINI
jgi:hypothetical protein|uniref:GDP-fucose protein O-fucosyltransferase n=1 Tax=viral metagenome TaxID=1070528 RepID=A0A6C0D8R5_9ZZZZ